MELGQVTLSKWRPENENTEKIPPKALSFEGSDNITICIFFFFRGLNRGRVNHLTLCPEVNQTFARMQ